MTKILYYYMLWYLVYNTDNGQWQINSASLLLIFGSLIVKPNIMTNMTISFRMSISNRNSNFQFFLQIFLIYYFIKFIIKLRIEI